MAVVTEAGDQRAVDPRQWLTDATTLMYDVERLLHEHMLVLRDRLDEVVDDELLAGPMRARRAPAPAT